MIEAAEHLWLGAESLVLASASRTRRLLLDAAGISVLVHPAEIDERSIEVGLQAKSVAPEGVAVALAEAKAGHVSRVLAGRYVLGADQTLALGSDQLHKARDLDDARRTLERLSGQQHSLHSGLALCRDGVTLWSHVETAKLHVRPLSKRFIECYLETMGNQALTSVGAYEYEGLGVHLFERVEGDHSTVLGLPLVPLLDVLRREHLVLS